MVGNGVSFVFAALLSGLLLRRRIGRIGLAGISKTVGKALIAAVVAAGAGLGVAKLLGAGETMTQGTAWLTLIVGGLVICGVYGAGLLLMGTREIFDLWGLVKSKLGRS